ncbi:unnamed protein product [Lymnaea stagnalis]|uniref:G-protein coupled receptors family 1 profile domain-containing protein n=1 Tax=Lymnaea stagnalis TaxID=6523 RepID=A0AAV2GZA5_LYMST
MALFNNCLLLVTLSTNRSLWSYTNAYIASLAVADLLLGLMLFIRNFWLFPSTEWVFENLVIACVPVTCLVYISAMESLACLVLMSADRYLYIVHPFWYELKITPRVTRVLIALSWCISISLGILPMWFHNFTPKLGCQPMLIISKSYLLGCLCVYFLSPPSR